LHGHVHRSAAALATLGITAVAGGCSDAQRAAPTTASPTGGTSNERTLTHAQSTHLVQWATTFRGCMGSRGWNLGELSKTPTHLAMAVPASIDVAPMMADMVRCGDAQGGPPTKSSLQYRAQTILLYLPKQCLLDPKVVSS
jgi:hypothetical protein